MLAPSNMMVQMMAPLRTLDAYNLSKVQWMEVAFQMFLS